MDKNRILEDEVVWMEGDYAIVRSIRLFCTGYNCYKRKRQGDDTFQKINEKHSWFGSLRAAQKWLKDMRKEEEEND